MTEHSTVLPEQLNAARMVLRQLQLKSAAVRLRDEFAGTFDEDTIERFLESAAHQFHSHADSLGSLPRPAERFARQRLQALAKVKGDHHAGKPAVMFVSTHNAGRTQMALGLFTRLAGDAAVAWSAGSAPSDQIDPIAVEAMAEIGIDIAEEYPKPWTEETVRAADVIITMTGSDTCPVYPGRRYEDWDLPGLASDRTLVTEREVRDLIEIRVRGLLDELGIALP
ncbi:arsenate reductase ArsC [Nocardia huaxiensis]|uniref:arsenate reductase ArsC n=1 Tax=Nocardia huaxiensis TaxID=2755382 RepID=UPI001E5E375F|nr:arsenate reductase ArsC [Nocardia huaxiensis]UFS97063.1 arsenate reductase ArsC [Nocardia huaxiensis]